MTEKERIALIRKGNQLFNEGKLEAAEKIFVATKYKDGLIRVGDYFYFDKKMPLFAYKYYKMANCKEKVNEIFERMIFALNKMLHKDEDSNNNQDNIKNEKSDLEEESSSPFKIKLEPIKVPAKLKLYAEEILRDNKNKK